LSEVIADKGLRVAEAC